MRACPSSDKIDSLLICQIVNLSSLASLYILYQINANNALDRSPPTMSEVCEQPRWYKRYRLMKTCTVRSKRRDQYQSDNRETNDKNLTLYLSNQLIEHNFSFYFAIDAECQFLKGMFVCQKV